MISVVVPAYNEESSLPACLAALRAQDYQGEYEVIVVDNGSTDRTAEVARDWGARVIFEPRPGVAVARQTGFEAARGEIIATTDADTKVPTYWLSEIDRLFRRHPRALAVGGANEITDGPFLARAWVKFCCFLAPVLEFLLPGYWNLIGTNFAVKGEAFHSVGGFDIRLRNEDCEDLDLSLRLRRKGRVIFGRKLCVHCSGRRYSRGIKRGVALYVPDIVRRYGAHFPFLSGTKRALAIMVGLALTFSLWAGISPASQVYGNTYIHGSRSAGAVALTFDVGPRKQSLDRLLDTLDTYQVKATFFVSGRTAELYPEMVSQIVERGHVLGTKGFADTKLLPLLPPPALRNEMQLSSEAIGRAAGVRPNLFRPPSGYKSPWMLRELRQRGYLVVVWDVSAYGWRPLQPGDLDMPRLEKAKPGSIILLRVAGDRTGQETEDHLADIITALQAKGYRLVTVPQLLASGQEVASPEGPLE